MLVAAQCCKEDGTPYKSSTLLPDVSVEEVANVKRNSKRFVFVIVSGKLRITLAATSHEQRKKWVGAILDSTPTEKGIVVVDGVKEAAVVGTKQDAKLDADDEEEGGEGVESFPASQPLSKHPEALSHSGIRPGFDPRAMLKRSVSSVISTKRESRILDASSFTQRSAAELRYLISSKGAPYIEKFMSTGGFEKLVHLLLECTEEKFQNGGNLVELMNAVKAQLDCVACIRSIMEVRGGIRAVIDSDQCTANLCVLIKVAFGEPTNHQLLSPRFT